MSRYICFRCRRNSVREDGMWCHECILEVGMPIYHRLMADKRLTKSKKAAKDLSRTSDLRAASETDEQEGRLEL